MKRITIVAIILAISSIGGTAPVGAVVPPGYRLLAGDGGVFTFGSASFHGSAASDPSKCPTNPPDRFLPDGSCVALASTPDGGGYWILNRALGNVYPFGDAGSFGQPADQFAGMSPEFVPAFLAIVSAPNADGYWVLSEPLSGAGSILRFGSAGFFGDTQTIVNQTHRSFNGSPVALAATPDGKGYWEVHSDGGVFAFGNAHFFGSLGAAHLNKPIVGIATTSDGKGYWLVASDGGVFAFGNARFGGSMAGHRLAAPIVGIAANRAGTGYWLTSSDGGVFALGGAPFLGSLGGKHLNKPMFAIAAA
jgi:ribosomal protein L24E